MIILRTVRMPQELFDWIKRQAEKEDRSWNQMAVRLMDTPRQRELAKMARCEAATTPTLGTNHE
jgi:hypothetical protein